MSVKRAQREVDSAEFAEWMAYSIWEPFGPDREDQRAGMVASIIANVNRDPKKRAEPYGPDDFFPRYASDEGLAARADAAAPPDLGSKMQAWAAKMNAANTPPKSELRPKKK